MSQIELTGLKSGTPIGFMAALGLFRNAMRMGELGEVRLSWVPFGGQWSPCLHTTAAVTLDEVIRLLLDRIKGLGERRELAWAAAIKSASREAYAAVARQAIGEASPKEHAFADWIAAFGSDLVTDDGIIEATPLDMTVARQQFLADAAWLTESLAAPDKKEGEAVSIASFSEALIGPWKYRDNQHSLGWDPSTLLMGAFTPKAPTAMSKAGVRGAVWLAMESLPYFPCVYDGGLGTRCFKRDGKKRRFVWPVWTEPLTEPAVRTLLSQISGADVEELKARGVAAIYSSEIYKPNKYLTSFQPAVLLG